LTVASLRELAAAEAATADIIIIGLHEGRGLPAAVSAWMKAWLGLRRERPGALVALLDADLKATADAEEILKHLRQTAEFGRMEFFATRAREGGEREVARWADRTVKQFAAARKPLPPDNLMSAAEQCRTKKRSDFHQSGLNSRMQKKFILNHDEIAKLACQLWQAEGRQSGRDNEYWLKAEKALRTSNQESSDEQNQATMKRKRARAAKNKSTNQSVFLKESRPAMP
jgi:hypothetical protein